MKKYNKIFAMVIIFLIISCSAFSVPDTCLTLIWPHNPPKSYNPDYILKDTCKDSPTFGQWYARGTFLVAMKQYIFSKLIVASSTAYSKDIDSINFRAEYDSVKKLENKYGKISYYRYINACDNEDDSAFIKAPCFHVTFQYYGLRLELIRNLYSVPGTISVYPPYTPVTVENEIDNDKLTLSPNPCYDKLFILNIPEEFGNDRKATILNMLGLPVISINIPLGIKGCNIDIDNLEEGIYFLNINNSIKKFIKLR